MTTAVTILRFAGRFTVHHDSKCAARQFIELRKTYPEATSEGAFEVSSVATTPLRNIVGCTGSSWYVHNGN